MPLIGYARPSGSAAFRKHSQETGYVTVAERPLKPEDFIRCHCKSKGVTNVAYMGFTLERYGQHSWFASKQR